MKMLSRYKLVPPLVKNIENLNHYPGYKYVYFSSFEEINEYFTKLCGESWIEEEWARFWLRDHWKTNKREEEKQYLPPRKKEIRFSSRPPRHILVSLCEMYKEQGMSLREIEKVLLEKDGIRLTYSAISRLLRNEELNGT